MKKKTASIVQKTLKIVFYIIFAVLLVAVAFSMVAKARGKIPFIGKYAPVWVLTDSMEGEIPAQSYILIRRAEPNSIREGDVITFHSDDPMLGGALNTHRVVEIREDGQTFVTKGDHNAIEDKYPARVENVEGVYVRKLPVMSFFGRLLSTPGGIFLTFAGIFILCFILYIPDLLKLSQKKQAQSAEPPSDSPTDKHPPDPSV